MSNPQPWKNPKASKTNSPGSEQSPERRTFGTSSPTRSTTRVGIRVLHDLDRVRIISSDPQGRSQVESEIVKLAGELLPSIGYLRRTNPTPNQIDGLKDEA